jgi:hypothetical protein
MAYKVKIRTSGDRYSQQSTQNFQCHVLKYCFDRDEFNNNGLKIFRPGDGIYREKHKCAKSYTACGMISQAMILVSSTALKYP